MKKMVLVLLVLGVAMPPIALADGAALYKSKCATCHGVDGKGDSPMGRKMNLRDLGSAEVQKQTDAQLHDWTANGKGKMPAYKGKLTDAELNALVAHMRTFAKK